MTLDRWLLGASPHCPRGALATHGVESKVRPNEGIALSLRNALLTSVAAAALFVSICWVAIAALFAYDAYDDPPLSADSVVTSLKIGLCLAPVAAIWYGGVDFLQHYVLRVMLAAARLLPLRLTRFLDHCVTHIFLQRVGGGYVFVHRLLLEHFAETPGEDGA